MTRERQVDKVKVCSEPDFFPSGHRQAGLWTWQTPLPVCGRSHTGARCLYMCCQAVKEFLAWGRIKHIYVQNPCLMPLSSLLWVLLASTFPGRDASKHGCACSGWKARTQARGASQGPGEERRSGEKQRLMISVWVVYIWVGPKLISALFCSYFSSVFSHFPQDLVWPRKLLKSSQT